MKNDICNKDYSTFVDIVQYKNRNYYDSYFHPLMEQLNIERTPHCCRHTCISMLAEAGVSQTMIKKIVGHAGAMTLTEKVYTHFDVNTISKYSLTVTPLVGNAHNKKGHFPAFATEKCPIHIIDIRVAYRLKSSTSDNFPQPL